MKPKFLVSTCMIFWISSQALAQSPTYQLLNLAVPSPLLPGAVVAADFNGDHKIDLAVATMGGFPNDQVVIYLNNGDGTFQPPKSFAVGTAVFAMIAGDFNGDGKIDLITGQTESKDLSVLMGNGDGTFQKAVSYPAGGAVGGLVAADFNGDGKLDIAVANQSPGSLSILLGHGDGTFGAASTQSLGMALVGITAADFNGDGKLDLAIADNNSTVWLLLGAGDGTFGTPQSIPLAGTLVGIASADFNGDKHADLAVANLNAASVYVLLGKGDGTFSQPPVWRLDEAHSRSLSATSTPMANWISPSRTTSKFRCRTTYRCCSEMGTAHFERRFHWVLETTPLALWPPTSPVTGSWIWRLRTTVLRSLRSL